MHNELKKLVKDHYLRIYDPYQHCGITSILIDDFKKINNSIQLSNHETLNRDFYIANKTVYNYNKSNKKYFVWIDNN